MMNNVALSSYSILETFYLGSLGNKDQVLEIAAWSGEDVLV